METTMSFAWVYDWLLATGYLLFGQPPAHMLEESATGHSKDCFNLMRFPKILPSGQSADLPPQHVPPWKISRV
jgi:hypothetical protein